MSVLNIDWAEHWRNLVVNREAQSRAVEGDEAWDRETFWDLHAQRFHEMTRRRGQEGPDRLLELVFAHMTAESTALDVGAGVGRYAIPLARQAREVVAVEPSEGMASFLERDCREQGITNIRVISSKWEEAECEPCDIVLCSHVLYTITDIAPFLRKLEAHAKRNCFIVLRTSHLDEHVAELWRAVHGQDRVPEPTHIDLHNLLHQMGIVANVEVMPFGPRSGPRWVFESIDEAMDHSRRRLYLLPGSPHDGLVKAYLERTLVEREGKLVWPTPAMNAAIVWWAKE